MVTSNCIWNCRSADRGSHCSFNLAEGILWNRWYGNTTINGVDVSKQTLAESKQKLIEAHKDYSLTIKAREDGNLTINGSDIDYKL